MSSDTKTLRTSLRVVFYKDDGEWVAHCLEFDLCGDGKTKEQALKSLSQAIQVQFEATVRHDNLDNLFSPADGTFFRKFAAGRNIAIGEWNISVRKMPIIIESTEVREYSDDPTESDLIPA